MISSGFVHTSIGRGMVSWDSCERVVWPSIVLKCIGKEASHWHHVDGWSMFQGHWPKPLLMPSCRNTLSQSSQQLRQNIICHLICCQYICVMAVGPPCQLPPSPWGTSGSCEPYWATSLGHVRMSPQLHHWLRVYPPTCMVFGGWCQVHALVL